MTRRGAAIAAAATAALAAGAATAWPAGDASSPQARPAALVVDAALGRAGRDLIDPRLRAADAAVRLPRSPREARIDVRYLMASGHAVVVVGPQSSAVAGPGARRSATLAEALAAVRR